ncbi:MAG: tRNA (guanosine(37)-N1)-methyltransferase TrmD [Candidatus Pacebacteria bacterium]|nr:tRNA (guanosine(37)-N1)-methyltransferase TrmD [Candidatus Paceibacterota bacterium]
MQFDIITIFPEIFSSYFSESIIKRALKKNLINIKIHNLRDFANDKRKTVDDRPYGGGPGMILMLEPIVKAIKKIVKKKKRKIVVLSAKGKLFDQKMAKEFSKLDQLVLISGHYEGIDERIVENIADMEVSIGSYVLTGGEVPCMAIVDAVARLIPGVINEESLKEESFSEKNNIEYPQYTRPAVFDISKIKNFPIKSKKKYWKVPNVLLSGNHREIGEWKQSKR